MRIRRRDTALIKHFKVYTHLARHTGAVDGVRQRGGGASMIDKDKKVIQKTDPIFPSVIDYQEKYTKEAPIY